jgi:hypothetical protein
MRSALLASVLVSSVFVVGSACGADTPAKKSVVPQAEPVLAWCQGSKTGDQSVLKTAFSEKVMKEHDRTGWEEVARRYKAIFSNLFGDYQLDEFSFEFTGDEEKGRIKIIHPRKTLQGIAVIKENGKWKVNEH